MRLDQVEHPLLDVRPDRAAPVGGAGRLAVLAVLPGRRGIGGAGQLQVGHVLDRHHDRELDALLARRRRDRHRAGAAEERGDLLRRAHGGGQPDALHQAAGPRSRTARSRTARSRTARSRNARSRNARSRNARGRTAGALRPAGCLLPGLSAAQRVQPFQGQGQVRAPLVAGQGVHLVDDHGLDAPERLPGLRCQQQEQRLGRGDQDVRRLT